MMKGVFLKVYFMGMVHFAFFLPVFPQVGPLSQFADVKNDRIDLIYNCLSDHPKGFGATYKNRETWNAIREKMNEELLIAHALVYNNHNVPSWDDSLYLEFSRNGVRPPGEKMIDNRINRLSPLVLAECIENQDKYTSAIEHLLLELISQPSWVSPAHDHALDNFHGRANSVDLRCARLALGLAQTLYMLDDKLCEEVKNAVTDSLYSRVFSPIMRALETGNFSAAPWLVKTNNWNPVCLSDITAAALAVMNDKRERALFVAAAEYYSQNGLSGYSDDGYCTEGLHYYNYGFGHYICLREQLFQQTLGLIDIFDSPKINNLLLYLYNIEIINGVYPAFADCKPGTVPSSLVLWFAKHACSAGNTEGLHKNSAFHYSGETMSAYFDVLGNSPSVLSSASVFMFPNTVSACNANAHDHRRIENSLRSYFDMGGVLVVRPFQNEHQNAIGAALKGGNNAEHHNHNDVGSYVVVKGNEVMAGDQGGPQHFAGDMFTDKRYHYKSLGSFGHPVPLINGYGQVAGSEARARVVSEHFTENADAWAIDCTSAYNVDELLQLMRTFQYNRKMKGNLTIEDRFEFSSPAYFETAIVTGCKWEKVDNGLLKIIGKKNTLFARISVSDGMDYSLVNETIEENAPPYDRIGIRLGQPVTNGWVKVEYSTNMNDKKSN
jgi:hypothetical protein